MSADLQLVEGFGDDPRQKSTLRKVGVAATLLVLGGIAVAAALGFVRSEVAPVAVKAATTEARLTEHVAQDEAHDKHMRDVNDAIWTELRIQNRRTMKLCQASRAGCEE